ncbi:MAG: 50S ribosomal protein L30 [Candidatus Izemoplasmatales bacterium]|mgnify:CR=1 FL=1|nr:50S ribosomal protein L30 [Candidatus Izemoplasmatales bacterium]MDD4069042.1 50S ribosomal protein L30 [Candidatus Izemoplasmatales bacterium]MDY0138591.1 50S ribosomal protein L30 [Candidatus Izemoplasmatales bacterium]HRV76414.1 50S ribosomal protein L30 [Candidatus Saccharimonadales bacterium]
MAQIKITLVKGLMGRKPNQVRTIKALGLTKRNSSVVIEENEMTKGMVNTVSHLVKVEEVKK